MVSINQLEPRESYTCVGPLYISCEYATLAWHPASSYYKLGTLSSLTFDAIATRRRPIPLLRQHLQRVVRVSLHFGVELHASAGRPHDRVVGVALGVS